MLKHIKTFYVELLPHLVILELQDFKGKPRFLYGDSMGASVYLLLHKRDPSFWDGVVLIAPMCKV